jgi:hypothetical protein
MSVDTTNTDPAYWEQVLGWEGMGNIDAEFWCLPEQFSYLNIEYNVEWDQIKFFKNEEHIWTIVYFKEDKYLQFVWNINWLKDDVSTWVANLISENIGWEYNGENIPHLWKYMLHILFTKFCSKWDEIKVKIENPKVRRILWNLENEWVIDSFWDINGIPSETIIRV